MARSAEHTAQTLEEALMALKQDPTHPVHAQADDLEVELRVVGKAKPPLGDFMAEGGGWKGESPEEILRLLLSRLEGYRRPTHGRQHYR